MKLKNIMYHKTSLCLLGIQVHTLHHGPSVHGLKNAGDNEDTSSPVVRAWLSDAKGRQPVPDFANVRFTLLCASELRA